MSAHAAHALDRHTWKQGIIMKHERTGDGFDIDDRERRMLERLLKRGGATLVIADDGEAHITTYFNTTRLRDCSIRHD